MPTYVHVLAHPIPSIPLLHTSWANGHQRPRRAGTETTAMRSPGQGPAGPSQINVEPRNADYWRIWGLTDYFGTLIPFPPRLVNTGAPAGSQPRSLVRRYARLNTEVTLHTRPRPLVVGVAFGVYPTSFSPCLNPLSPAFTHLCLVCLSSSGMNQHKTRTCFSSTYPSLLHRRSIFRLLVSARSPVRRGVAQSLLKAGTSLTLGGLNTPRPPPISYGGLISELVVEFRRLERLLIGPDASTATCNPATHRQQDLNVRVSLMLGGETL